MSVSAAGPLAGVRDHPGFGTVAEAMSGLVRADGRCGVGFYQSCLIGRATSEQALLRVFPYLAAVVATLILVAAIPRLSLGLLHR